MVKIIPYLAVKNGKKAIALYENLFEVEVKRNEPFTEEMGKEFGFPEDYDYENSTMHAELEIYGNEVYLSDDVHSSEEEAKGRVDVLLDLETKEQIEKIYNKAKELGCKISKELEKQFWGAYFASFQDEFGIGWQLNFNVGEE
jgi:PhnB protein